MSASFFQLLYFSRADSDLGENDVKHILEHAHENNKARGITGLLLHEQGHFLQLLEGPKPEVEQLYHRIAADPRHSAVSLIFTREVTRRDFEDWSMAHGQLEPEAEAESLRDAFQQACTTGVAPEATIHRKASAEQLVDYFRILLSAPPLP